MKKILPLLLLLIALGATAYYLNNQDDKNVSYDLSDSNFTVSKEDIHKIYIAYKDRPAVELVKNSNKWYVQDSFATNPEVMQNIINVFTRAKISYIPPKTMLDFIYKGIGTYGIKVELYDDTDKLLKSYYIGGNDNKEEATFFLMDGAKQPYAVRLPGLNGNLRDRFKLTSVQWRDKTIFPVRSEDIKLVEVIFPKQKSISFKLSVEGKDYKIDPFYSTTQRMDGKVNRSNSMTYLMAATEAKAESRIKDYSKFDSLNHLVPYCIVNMTLKNGNKEGVKFIPMHEEGGNSFGTIPADRFFAIKDNGDLMLTQKGVIEEYFKPYDYFFLK